MREVRMTFGEHLEELRSRIIVSLLWLLVGVVVSFIYGDQLMKIALRPHERAFQGAQRDRMIARMERIVAGIQPLATMDPTRATFQGRPLANGPIRWEEIFVGVVARKRVEERIRTPFATLDASLGELSSLPASDRKAMQAAFHQLGEDLADALVADVATELDLVGAANLPRRFRAFRDRLVRFRDSSGSAGDDLKAKIGWGKDLDPLIDSISKFDAFLQSRRQEAAKTDLPLQELRRAAEASPVARGLDDVVRALEGALDEMVVSVRKPRIQVIDYTEHFIAFFKVAMIFGLFLAVPFILYEMWKFIGAGLHLHEQRYVVTFLPFSLLLFLMGVLFGYYAMIPVGLRFLASWGATDVELNFVLGNYIGLFLTLTLILGLVFQTPLVMVFFNRIGVVAVETYRRMRRVAIFVGVCLAVVLTPPDPVSWSLMAVPMIFLYEVGILVCRFLDTRKPEST